MKISQIKRQIKKHLKEFFLAILFALFIRVFLIEPYYIPTSSMSPNIVNNDRILALKSVYNNYLSFLDISIPGFTNPESGDEILFQAPVYQSPGKVKEWLHFFTFGLVGNDNTAESPKFFIKRVIGEPGDYLELFDFRKTQDASLKINGKTIALQSAPDYLYDQMNVPQDKVLKIETNRGKNYVVQYDKANKFTSLLLSSKGKVETSQRHLYLPAKGDLLQFRLLTPLKWGDFPFDLDTIKEFGAPIDLPQKLQFEVRVMKKNKSESLKFVIDGYDMNWVYATPFVYNQILTQDHIYQLIKNGFIEVEAQDNYYFMMGDNRDNSSDSRYWGMVPSRLLIGKPWLRIYPFSRFGAITKKVSADMS